MQQGGIQFTLAPSPASSSTASGQTSSSAPTATAAPGATTAPGVTGAPTAAPGATATIPGQPLGTPTSTATLVPTTPTATLVPPTLEVNPTVIQLPACLSAQTYFTVLHTGGAPFSWTATASDATYTISPAGGTLAGGSHP